MKNAGDLPFWDHNLQFWLDLRAVAGVGFG
jgi:hypothetical protein